MKSKIEVVEKYFTRPEIDALSRLIIDIRKSWPKAKFKLFGSKLLPMVCLGFRKEEKSLLILVMMFTKE